MIVIESRREQVGWLASRELPRMVEMTLTMFEEDWWKSNWVALIAIVVKKVEFPVKCLSYVHSLMLVLQVTTYSVKRNQWGNSSLVVILHIHPLLTSES